MQNIVKIEVRDVYGNTLLYPACDNAHLFCALTGNKTLTQKDIKVIKSLGYDVQVITRAIAGL